MTTDPRTAPPAGAPAAAPTVHTTRHTIEIEQPADRVYRLVADVERWPQLLEPTIHARRIGGDDREELIALWAMANGDVRTWTSRRHLDPVARRIRFRQERPAQPLAAMGGTWVMEPAGDRRTHVVLDHDFATIDDDADAAAWVTRAVDTNSTAELAAIKAMAERADKMGPLEASFEDGVHIDGPAESVYRFLRDADRWPERLPHVARMELTEETDGVQVMSMETRAPDGSSHTTRSVRVCFDDEHRIVYKQVGLPALLGLHTGEWTLRPDGAGVHVTSQHTVRIKPEAIAAVLGEDGTVDRALAFVRNALGTNSLATLERARAFATAEPAAADRG